MAHIEDIKSILTNRLRERCIFSPEPFSLNNNNKKEYILYWIRGALRLDQCPTFDVARLLAKHFKLPLLIYLELNGQYYRLSSYRSYKFLLEGAVDLQELAKKLGYKFFLHIQRQTNNEENATIISDQVEKENEHRLNDQTTIQNEVQLSRQVKELTLKSLLVVTDLMDLYNWRELTGKLRDLIPVIEVDSNCVLPRPVFGKSVDRPFKFKEATNKRMMQQLESDKDYYRQYNNKFEQSEIDISFYNRDFLPQSFKPINNLKEILQMDGGLSLLSECNDIDPTVIPVTDIQGGYLSALERWHSWIRKGGIKNYHRWRNNAALEFGVSGMSPYIHYGMICPSKLARDVQVLDGPGTEKWLTELLQFREHAQHHCYSSKTAFDWNQLPEFARVSWNQIFENRNSNDNEFIELSDMTLERGGSGNVLWDHAQIGLLRHGVMHNNVRMTWGKAFPLWVKDPKRAAELAFMFNDLYSLDGNDASSITGVLWCFGLFDRPFSPYDSKVMGNVRPRPLSTHQARLDLEKYSNLTSNKPSSGKMMNIAIIGSGISGSFAGYLLQKLGHNITLWDKGRGVSGRLCSKRMTDNTRIHIGAQTMDSLPKWSERYIQEWVNLGFVDKTTTVKTNSLMIDHGNNFLPFSLIPKTSFTDILKFLTSDLKVHYERRVALVEAKDDFVQLNFENDEENKPEFFDKVIIALPVEQSNQIFNFNQEEENIFLSESVWVIWGPITQKNCAEIENKIKSEYIPFCSSVSFKYHDTPDMTTLEVRLHGYKSDTIKTRNDMVNDLTQSIFREVNDDVEKQQQLISKWNSHFWRYSRPVKGPGRVLHKGNVSFIGDAFGKPIGTVGAALDSAARVVSDLHLTKYRDVKEIDTLLHVKNLQEPKQPRITQFFTKLQK